MTYKILFYLQNDIMLANNSENKAFVRTQKLQQLMSKQFNIYHPALTNPSNEPITFCRASNL